MIILVTGGSGDIGEAICRRLAEAGHKVALQFHRSEKRAQKIAREISGLAIKADVSDSFEVKVMVKEIIKKWGRLEGLVNVAGFPIAKGTRHYWDLPFEKVTPWMFRDVFDVDTMGSIHCIQAALPWMKKWKFGKILNFVSASAIHGHQQGYPFNVAKGGLLSLTKGLALEVARQGITVNAVAPCSIATRWLDLYPRSFKKRLVRQIPLGRLGTPQDVASLVNFLMSSGSDWLTGKVYMVDGGEVSG